VFVAFAAEGILAAEKAAADAATDYMVVRRGFQANELVSGPSHDVPPWMAVYPFRCIF
jgi:hypothetical protein